MGVGGRKVIFAKAALWGTPVGVARWDKRQGIGVFEYDRDFIDSGKEVSPLMMPLAARAYSFPALPRGVFHGLPGMLSDSLPDKFGNALIDAWLARQGRTADSFTPIERLCYIGRRGMGAIEYQPVLGPGDAPAASLDLAALTELAGEILTQRGRIDGSFAYPKRERSLRQIFTIGTSAGGARAKAVVAWNPDTNEVRSGQCDAARGFSHWILKFDGVSGNRDRELEDPRGYGLIEFAYYKMATAAGIDMSECRLLKENDRAHFMTRRFDRADNGDKIHMQSLGAMAHYDFTQVAAYSYEQALRVVRRLDLPTAAMEQQFRRMAFNIVARNQDDHVKNIAFLMNRAGGWSLSPAFDMTYSYNPQGAWTGRHQMTLNGKNDGFAIDDFRACAKSASLKRGRADDIIAEVTAAVTDWPKFAAEAGVAESITEQIRGAHRLEILQ